MLDEETRAGNGELQFDRVISESAASAPSDTLAVTCAVCQAPIETEYFDVNGSTLCRRCRAVAEAAAETPRGIVPLIKAGLYGLGAGVFGAVLYYAVMAIAHLEIGILAILIGYMVGYAVRTGARGRGGVRFQVLAVALTYASIALAYAPMAFTQAIKADRTAQHAPAATAGGNPSTAPATERGPVASPTTPSGGRVLLSLVFLVAFIAALPALVVFGSLPSGLISGFIIFIGMRQAWKMTGAPWLQILGPYRVGAGTAVTPA